MSCQNVISCYLCGVPVSCLGGKGLKFCASCEECYDGAQMTKYAVCFNCQSNFPVQLNMEREIEKIREEGRGYRL